MGSIPACAGEPAGRGRSPGRGWVYPRVCGGARGTRSQEMACHGLSPRVRGSPVASTAASTAGWSIPACAGEPRTSVGTATSERVYPRVCGGASTTPLLASFARGLSPRVRGSLASGVDDGQMEGSIPACAGEPGEDLGRTVRVRVYPRVCGGAGASCQWCCCLQGLSPRVRGSREFPRALGWVTGSIPACAGEPNIPPRRPCRLGVYPRVCGGASVRGRGTTSTSGLSPRVRGSPSDEVWAALVDGSIPACAGEPQPAGASPQSWGVYPRVCGGASPSPEPWPAAPGLSPRVRGSRKVGVGVPPP